MQSATTTPTPCTNATAILQKDVEPVYGPEAALVVESQTVLVTGAGGSIGSEIVRQLIHLGAGKIVCVDNDEYALYRLELGLRGRALLTDDNLILGDITNPHEITRIFEMHYPQLVFHAAARKHLPLLERSPAAAVLTNVLGTMVVAQACLAGNVKRFVNISTDKAANPTSVLGMTKRLAEMIAFHHTSGRTHVASVRFGNVFNSRGSFVETFMHQIAHNLPVTVTDEDMTRYFMTIPQAAGLVIEAACRANGGDTFVLDMGDSFRIVDLIHRYADLIGVQAQIVYTGMRPGEKLDEELFDPSEIRLPTTHPAITAVHVNSGGIVPLENIRALCHLADRPSTPSALREELEATLALSLGSDNVKA